MTTLFGFATLDLAGLLVVTTITQFLESAFLVELLLQPAQGAVDDLTFLHADFGIHNFFTPFRVFQVVVLSKTYSII